jgi:hypothetical protein
MISLRDRPATGDAPAWPMKDQVKALNKLLVATDSKAVEVVQVLILSWW